MIALQLLLDHAGGDSVVAAFMVGGGSSYNGSNSRGKFTVASQVSDQWRIKWKLGV